MPSYKYYITSLLSSYAVSTDTLLMFIERRRRRALVRGVLAKCIGLWVIVPTLEAVPEVVYSARGCIEIQSSFPLNIKHTRYGQHHTWAAILAAAIPLPLVRRILIQKSWPARIRFVLIGQQRLSPSIVLQFRT